MALLRRAAVACLVWLAALGVFPACAGSEPPRAEAAPAVRAIAVGDTFRLEITLTWSEGCDVKPIAIPDKIGNFVVKDIAEGPALGPASGRASGTAGGSSRKVSLVLTCFDTGTQTVPAIPIVYTNKDGSGGTIETSPVAIEVKSVLPENANDIRDIKHPIRVPKRWKDIILSYTLIAGLAAAAALSVLISFKRREEIVGAARKIWSRLSGPIRRLILWLLVRLGLRRRAASAAFDICVDEPDLVPAEAAFKELDRIRALGLPERAMTKEFYTLVSETVRRFIERQFGVLAMESPTSLTVEMLGTVGISGQAVGLTEGVLGESDLVKFAKFTPPQHVIDTLLERAREVVRAMAAEVVAR